MHAAMLCRSRIIRHVQTEQPHFQKAGSNYDGTKNPKYSFLHIFLQLREVIFNPYYHFWGGPL
jgi:hypothetical protein